ncbi:MAG: hypothetical protein DWQ01_08225 [Planctomycetota bacterium]|nr:MAG: hypothetical protein DWQ01_08225 [Planctomycetota bacterium]
MAKAPSSKVAALELILKRLVRSHYAVPYRDEEENALERLLALILQGTGPYSSARKAVKALRRSHANWNETRVARLFEVRGLLQGKRVGTATERAEATQEFLRRVFGLQNHLDLDWLYDATSERRERLLNSLTMTPDHVGPVLDLDAAVADGDPLPPITTDLKRLFARLGLVPSNPKDAAVKELTEPMLEGDNLYPRFLALQLQARRVCESKHPRCRQCPLLDLCPHGKKLLGNAGYQAALEDLGLKKAAGGSGKAKKGASKKSTKSSKSSKSKSS